MGFTESFLDQPSSFVVQIVDQKVYCRNSLNLVTIETSLSVAEVELEEDFFLVLIKMGVDTEFSNSVLF